MSSPCPLSPWCKPSDIRPPSSDWPPRLSTLNSSHSQLGIPSKRATVSITLQNELCGKGASRRTIFA
jgi:hypothetical protein